MRLGYSFTFAYVQHLLNRLSSTVCLGATASLVFGGVNSAVAAELEILQTPALNLVRATSSMTGPFSRAAAGP